MTYHCNHCESDKPPSEFYAASRSKCKSCVRLAVLNYRWNNIERVRAVDRKRGLTAEHRAQVKAYAQTAAGKAARLRGNREWRRRNREKVAAHKAVAKALFDGRLIRGACEVCREPKVQAHHDDYRQPLAVRWLCDTHHKTVHKR